MLAFETCFKRRNSIWLEGWILFGLLYSWFYGRKHTKINTVLVFTRDIPSIANLTVLNVEHVNCACIYIGDFQWRSDTEACQLLLGVMSRTLQSQSWNKMYLKALQSNAWVPFSLKAEENSHQNMQTFSCCHCQISDLSKGKLAWRS